MPLAPLEVKSAAEWLAALPDDSVTILYKHSTRCGVSLDARFELDHLLAAEPEIPVWLVDVVRQRSLSEELAGLLGIAHASPQVILLRGARPVWHTSHQRITRDALRARLAEPPPG